MALRCGLHAVNAILTAAGGPSIRTCDAAELDAITAELHRRERALCPEGRDTAPDPEGNYPVETLFVALRRRGLRSSYERRVRELVPRTVVGYLLGTGSHYLALVRTRHNWQLFDDGVPKVSAERPTTIVNSVSGVCAVVRVTR